MYDILSSQVSYVGVNFPTPNMLKSETMDGRVATLATAWVALLNII